jgi:hypothetical protein
LNNHRFFKKKQKQQGEEATMTDEQDHNDDPSSSSSSSPGKQATSGATVNFPIKLMQILSSKEPDGETTSYKEIVHWTSNGKAFKIENRAKLSSQLLPLYFGGEAEFRSFTRRLLRWGFRRIIKKGTEDHGAFFHELFQRDSPALCHQIKTREKINMAIEGVETKREEFKRKEREAIASMVSMSCDPPVHDSADAPESRKSPLLMRHKKFKKTTGGLLNMPFVHAETANTKRQHILTQMKEHQTQTSVVHSKQQRGAPVSAAPMGGAGAAQAMQEFRHAQDAMVQARNRLLAHQAHTLHQQEQLQLARRSPLVEEVVRHNQYVVLGSCASAEAQSFASLEHTIAMHQQALYYHAAGARNHQLYPADGAQQGPSARPASVGGPGSCRHSVVHSQGYADTTKQALFQSILKKQGLKQEVERLAERNRQLSEAHAAMEDSIRPGSTPRATDRAALVSLYQKENACTSRLRSKNAVLEDVAAATRTMAFPQGAAPSNMKYGHHLGVPYSSSRYGYHQVENTSQSTA